MGSGAEIREYRLGRLRGKFCVVWYEDGRRHRRSLRTDDRGEAERRLRRFANAKPSITTVDWIWREYLHDKAGRPIATTMGYTGKAILPHFGQLDAEEITVGDCRAYTAHRRSLGRSDGSIHTELGHLRSALVWAEKRRHIKRAPHIEKPSKPAPRDRYLTKSEAELLLANASTPHIRLTIILALGTAARIEALLQLTWDRVDFDAGLIHLRDRADTTRRKGRATVPMNRSARAALQHARSASMTPYVIEWAGKPVKSIKRGMMRAAERAKLDGVSAHVLRHSAAVWMAEAQVPMEEIAQYLGHDDVATTRKVYARFSPEYLRGAASALEVGLVQTNHRELRRSKLSD